ncbi:hypothetical protein PIB30_045660 [Stylosanthes scabra]|uniref:Pentatricopeptide repeat-containing protein At1g74600, chloroplastic n=1 Tax=Stylosanthes scabra TaxID=79078 RepID=A0ABU6QFU5_9FABA|nr:hypothetical protein [Stylosanthes scabra]
MRLGMILMNSRLTQSFHKTSSRLAWQFTTSPGFIESPFVHHVKHEDNYNDWNSKYKHTHLIKTPDLQSDIFAVNSLLDFHCKSADMVVAHQLFDTIAVPNVVSWNIMISGYMHNSMFQNSWEMFCRMHSIGVDPNEFSYGSVLSACVALQGPLFGKQVLSLVLKNGFLSSSFVQTQMLQMFSKFHSFKEVLRFFNYLSCTNVACWNAMISGAVKAGESCAALNMFRQMLRASMMPNSYTFPSILTACCILKHMQMGKVAHGLVVKCCATDIFVKTAIVDFYTKFGCMDEAFREFSDMSVRNVVSWTAIISGFVRDNDIYSALKLFKDMRQIGQEINSYTLTSVLSACAKPGMIDLAVQIHSLVLKLGFCLHLNVGAALINMYAKMGEVELSELAFIEMEDMKDQSTWAAILSSFAQNQKSRKVVELFRLMLREGVKPDEYCISSVLSIISCLTLVTQMHSYTLKSGLVAEASVGCSLFTIYSKCGGLEDSYKIFRQVPVKDKVSWTSMIAGLAEHGYAGQALQLFRDMIYQEIIPDHMVLIPTLSACSSLHSLKMGKEIHGYAFCLGIGENSVFCGALVNMYSKCGSLNSARTVFNMLPEKDPFACSSMVAGYAQRGLTEKAFLLFREMLFADVSVDSSVISSILGAAAYSYRSEIGTQLHAYIEKLGLQADVYIGSSLVTMYSKCGSIEDCQKSFDDAEKPDVIGWTSMIVSYAYHGKGEEALAAYELMRKEGIQPDAVTFVGILSACSHSGLVEEAFFYLNSMLKDYGIAPGHRHYASIVDVLGRSGRVREAERFINEMPVEADALIWETLLAACKVHGDFELGKVAAEKVMEFRSSDAGAYVSLSNICADVGQWEEVAKIRSSLNWTGMKKEPGWSVV